MESLHVVINSVHEGTIDGDDALRILTPSYTDDPPCSVAELEQYMRDLLEEKGILPEDFEFIDFCLCGECHKLIVWDEVTETYRHLIKSTCTFLQETVSV